MGVAVTEPTEDIEDQDAILHGPAEVAKGVRHALHLTTELANGEVTLDEGAEAGVETQSPGLSIAQELPFKGKPRPAHVRRVADEVVEVQGDRPQDLGEDNAVETEPRRRLDDD
jgi:hypothetical protein